MIGIAMAVAAAVSPVLTDRAAQAREARWPRLRALLLDLIAFSIVLSIVNWIYAGTAVAAWASLCLLWMAYYIVPESLYGASLGKMLLGLLQRREDLAIGQSFGDDHHVDVAPGGVLAFGD